MTGRERVTRALTHQALDRAPRNLWALPGIPMFRQAALDGVLRDYPQDITGPVSAYAPGNRRRGQEGRRGQYMDDWGSLWDVKEDGIIGEVKQPLFANGYEGLDAYQPPRELLAGVDLTAIARQRLGCEQFILAGTQTRPFERMQFLRGTENLLMDIALDEQDLYRLRDKVHSFCLEEMRLWARSAVDGVSFMDDWGSQRALLISPSAWRRLFKPLYREYCDILRGAGKYVFFHSDGFIEDIYPDLIDIGVNAVNSQLFCMDMEKLGRNYAGRIAFWGEVDRQRILPFGTLEDARMAVRRLHGALCPGGRLRGVFAQCEWGMLDPEENIRAVFAEWDQIGAEQSA